MKYVLPVILGTGIIVFLVWYFTDYKTVVDGCVGKISFDRFLLFYEIEPKHWDLYPSWVKYDNQYNVWTEYDTNTDYDNYISGYLYFSVIDTWRYQIWKRNGEKVKNTAWNNKNYQRILESINADIEKFRRKESMNNMNHEELLLKNQAIILLSLLAIFSKSSNNTPEDLKLAQAISEQIDKTCAVLPDDEEEEES